LTAPWLGRLRSIGLNGLGLGDEEAIALAERGHLDRCEWLDLRRNRIGPRGVAALLANPTIRRMPVVLLHGNVGNPSIMVDHDLDGSVLDYGLPPDGLDAEAHHGPIRWLFLHPLDHGDRFHASAAEPLPRRAP